jgi:nucleoid-associated protein YgaU
LFSPDGQPLRAKISASFNGFIEDTLRAAQEDSSSPDLTHLRIVQDGDTLPLMTYRIYGDSKYYYQVAEFNGLSNLKKLETGQKIYFPPLITEK